MSGHSKWSKIKRKKGASDEKRGKIFSKLSKEISVAARGGADPDFNFQLRLAVDRAKEQNMPKDNVERAIQKGAGAGAGVELKEVVYEGFGPAGSAIIVVVLTDNLNRTASDIKHIFTKNNGSLGGPGSVMWQFEKLGVIRITSASVISSEATSKPSPSPSFRPSPVPPSPSFRPSPVLRTSGEISHASKIEQLELLLIDAGAEDIKSEYDEVAVFTKIENLQKVKEVIDKEKIEIESAGIEYVPKEEVSLGEEDEAKLERLLEMLDDSEDVSDVFTNVK